ncbi:hypothetical protein GRX01_04770 [Halobaculum sp. WSA2]|uniref:Uncharacterized protein n=1 Tax=Halobaculum saliterrae TaxID=2073113 RepID=A0A6B0SVG9_9EURY|nr:hypothetical protein [Halobaculum saliterrae]MXR40661.1 hypothetical protein [Halobaculum saliterrae]
MYERTTELLPVSWTVTEQTDSRIEYKRLAEYGAETKAVRVSGKRICSGGQNNVDPRWVLGLTTGMYEFETTDRFDTACCREDADRKLVNAMEVINRVLDRSDDGYVSHKRMVEPLNTRPSVRLR